MESDVEEEVVVRPRSCVATSKVGGNPPYRDRRSGRSDAPANECRTGCRWLLGTCPRAAGAAGARSAVTETTPPLFGTLYVM